MVDYHTAQQNMQDYTLARTNAPSGQPPDQHHDQLWLLEHPSVITTGISAQADGVQPNAPYPVVASNRGGQATCHNPGQLVAYFLVDIRKRALTIRSFVSLLERSIITLLAGFGLRATTTHGAHGVYVNQEKIASIGLRVSHGCTSHGISINIDNDLSIFNHIHPCGNPLLTITSLKQLGITTSVAAVINRYTPIVSHALEQAEEMGHTGHTGQPSAQTS